MPATSPCNPCCTTTQVTDVPGAQGGNAYTVTLANITIPAVDGSVAISVADSSWMVQGQPIFISDDTIFGHFTVTSVVSPTSITATFNGQEGDSSPTDVISSGAKVVPGGTQQDITLPLSIANGGTGQITAAAALSALLGGAPLPVANGGTAGATKAAAIAALGVGQDTTADNNAGVAYDITNAPAQITGVAATTPFTGKYLILAVVTVDYSGTTFASNRTLTLTIRNATSAANLLSIARNTEVFTTTNQPSIDYTLFVQGSLTASDSIQVWASLDTVESAGTSRVSACNLILVPIAI